MKRTAREVLNEIRWRAGRLADVIVSYRDRTRREQVRLIRGSQIVGLERRYFVVPGGRLPYYKVERIELDGTVLFDRRSSGPS
jgi:uncharacterized protein (UPF0248 family)